MNCYSTSIYKLPKGRLMTISAKIIADSVNPEGERITTFELEYPRFIHAEFMTHRDFSRNAASSRAIPIKKMVKLIWADMATPIHWGAKQTGMQADNQLTGMKKWLARAIWKLTGYMVSLLVLLLNFIGLHKQVANRMLEPWSHIKVVMTTTRMANWNKLRLHPAAQPEIYELAKQMDIQMKLSTPRELQWRQWHLPYVTIEDIRKYGIDHAKKMSTTACAQVSYRVLDLSEEKVQRIFDLLINADVVHASPFEHPARAMKNKGSGNFTGTSWRQYRADIEDNF